MAVDFPKPVIHGGTGKRQRENTGKNLLDFSASLNPLPPRFAWTCDPGCLSSYPDNGYSRLKERIAQVFHRDTEEICVGNGSIELIRVFCSVVLSGKKTYHTTSPTFGEYEPLRPAHRCRCNRQPGDRDRFLCLQSQQSDRRAVHPRRNARPLQGGIISRWNPLCR